MENKWRYDLTAHELTCINMESYKYRVLVILNQVRICAFRLSLVITTNLHLKLNLSLGLAVKVYSLFDVLLLVKNKKNTKVHSDG